MGGIWTVFLRAEEAVFEEQLEEKEGPYQSFNNERR
jgi:hypothetical protein